MRRIIIEINDDGFYNIIEEQTMNINHIDDWTSNLSELELRQRMKDMWDFWMGFDEYLKQELGDQLYRNFIIEYSKKKVKDWKKENGIN